MAHHPHFAGAILDQLNRCVGLRWTSRCGPIAWHPQSPDLTPLDFYQWGHMKSLVYQIPVDTVEDLLARVLGAAQEIQQTPGVMKRVYQNMSRRYNVCNKLGGRILNPFCTKVQNTIVNTVQ